MDASKGLKAFRWPVLRAGRELDGSPIEAVGAMHALVYFAPGDIRVIPDRPLAATAHDVIARVLLVHRCGTDVKIFHAGRRDQVEESLLEELARLVGSEHPGESAHYRRYVRLLETGTREQEFDDPLYRDVAAAVARADDLETVRANLNRHWGRIIGHETVVEIVRVGSRVGELTAGIGYAQGERLDDEYLDFREGEICTLQSRVAHYRPPPVARPGLRGVQLLGGNITDLAMNQGGGFAQYVRLRPEMIRSRSILRVPAGIDRTSAALIEPLACILDCVQKSTHETGQDDRGSVLRRGVLPGGRTLVIGSGAMALMAGKIALMDDSLVELGGARGVAFAVRSETKRDLVTGIMGRDPRVQCVICERDEELPDAVRRQFRADDGGPTEESFRGFDDVIIAAGDAQTVAMAHRLIAPTGARILAFAGTRWPCSVESGVWHYGNAGILGSSGCNTKTMELALGLIARGSIDVKDLSGRTWTFAELKEEGVAAFFEDRRLRPALAPNEGLKPVRWR